MDEQSPEINFEGETKALYKILNKKNQKRKETYKKLKL